MILCALILIIAGSACAEDKWECTGCGKRIPVYLGDICPYCGTHNHHWTPASCTEPETCSCGETRGAPLGHDWREATCTEAKTCARCDPAGHQWDGGVQIRRGTCVETGLIRYTCAVCGETQEESSPVDPDNHEGNSELRGQKDAACFVRRGILQE